MAVNKRNLETSYNQGPSKTPGGLLSGAKRVWGFVPDQEHGRQGLLGAGRVGKGAVVNGGCVDLVVRLMLHSVL